jgi:hypothetical protein
MTGLSLDIAANTRAAQSNIRDLGKALDDTSDALDDVARDSGRSADKVEASFRDMVRASERAGRDIASDAKDAAAKVGREYSDAARDAGRDITKGVGDGLRGAKDEAKQSGREAAASFSGEWEDAASFVQETMANAFEGFGPIGAAAGIAAAVGLGAVTAEIDRQNEKADALRERLAGVYREAAEEGRSYIDTAQVIAEANDLMFNKDRAEEWKQLQADANRLGLDTYTIIAANTGERGAQEEVQKRILALWDEELSKASDSSSIVGNVGQSVAGLKNRWDEVITTTEEQQAKVRELQAVQAASEEAQREQIDRTARAAQERYEGLAAQYGNPITAQVRYEVDDSAVRNYKPPTIRGTLRLSPRLDQAV